MSMDDEVRFPSCCEQLTVTECSPVCPKRTGLERELIDQITLESAEQFAARVDQKSPKTAPAAVITDGHRCTRWCLNRLALGVDALKVARECGARLAERVGQPSPSLVAASDGP